MLRDIYDYGITNPDVSEEIDVAKVGTIRVYIHISNEGVYHNLEITDKKERNNGVLLEGGTWAETPIHAIPFVNNIKRIIPKWSDEDNVIKAHRTWLQSMRDADEHIHELKPVTAFIETFEQDSELQETIRNALKSDNVKTEEYITFKVEGIPVLEMLGEKGLAYFRDLISTEKSTSERKYVSSITGKEFSGIMTPWKIKGSSENKSAEFTPANLGTGVSIASYKPDSFRHYGMEENDGREGTHVSQDEANIIKNALKYLLASPEHYNNSFNLVFWYTGEKVPNIIGDSLSTELSLDDLFSDNAIDEKNANYAIRSLLQSMIRGNKPKEHYAAEYHMFNFEVTSQGRCMIFNEKNGKYDQLSQGLFNWYRDSEIACINKGQYYEKPIFNIYGILPLLLEHEDANNKYDQVNAEFGKTKNNLLETVYENKQLPDIYANKAVRKANKIMLKAEKRERIVPIAQVLKVYLKRKKVEIVVDNKLNKDCSSSSYQLGRYFAVCEKLQFDSSNGKTSTIGNYFEGMQKSPEKIYPRMTNLSKVYIKKLNVSGIDIFYKQLLAEIGSKITETPKRMNLEQKSEFILGYYQENTDLYKKKENKEGE